MNFALNGQIHRIRNVRNQVCLSQQHGAESTSGHHRVFFHELILPRVLPMSQMIQKAHVLRPELTEYFRMIKVFQQCGSVVDMLPEIVGRKSVQPMGYTLLRSLLTGRFNPIMLRA